MVGWKEIQVKRKTINKREHNLWKESTDSLESIGKNNFSLCDFVTTQPKQLIT